MLCSKWGRGDKREAKLASALDGRIASSLLFRQGVPPHATYLFKHALVQDAAYGTLLRDARRALHVSFTAGAAETKSWMRCGNVTFVLAIAC